MSPGNEDNPDVVAASFVGMHMERDGSVVDADLAASTTILSIEELEEGEMLRVGLGRWNPSNFIIGSEQLKTVHFSVRRLS